MIRAVIVINDQGKPRLVKFYDYQPVEKQQEIIRNIYGGLLQFPCGVEVLIVLMVILFCILCCGQFLCSRAENVSNFVQDSTFGPDTRLVYKTFATLYFIVIFDESENELAILDLMQVFVETLDKCFSNVCELDIVFNFNKVHTILDEIILGGQVVEMSSSEVVKSIDDISWLEKNPNSITRVSKSISGWQGR
ncbi:putative adaptor protein complex, sigma subunit [Helianthus annuus]|nr:putative adaptor protein complex, sigma subunit [Helianthus annuus]